MLGDRTGQVLVSSVSPSAWARAFKGTTSALKRTGSQLGEGMMAVGTQVGEG